MRVKPNSRNLQGVRMKGKSKKTKVKNRLISFRLYFGVSISLSLLLFFSLSSVKSQTGGSYDLSHNVIASGGSSNSTGGQFSLSGTVGQTSAGTTSTNGKFRLRGGFWAFDSLAPNAALVSISGRVTAIDGTGIRNVRLSLTSSRGDVRTIQTGSFGYFRFDEIEVGQICILQISSKRFTFANPTRILNVQEEIADANFVAEPNFAPSARK